MPEPMADDPVGDGLVVPEALLAERREPNGSSHDYDADEQPVEVHASPHLRPYRRRGHDGSGSMNATRGLKPASELNVAIRRPG